MKKIITNSLLVLAAVTIPQLALANLAPHWTPNNINCLDCHQNHMGPKTACEFCHNNDSGANYSKTSAPVMATHSSTVLNSTQYGTWARQCADCHNPHVSGQCATPLVEGTFTALSTGSGTTTFTIDTVNVHDSSWQNPADWNSKSGNERGLIFLAQGLEREPVYGQYLDFSSEIIDATPSSITVQGNIGQVSTVVQNFKILYGQYIKDEIEGKSVSFSQIPSGLALDQSGSGTDASPDGVCQVCHTQTKYWRNDGSRASHFNGENCLSCHEHELGFKPSCNACHGFPPVQDSPYQVNGLVWNPEPTGATSAGAHQVHAGNNGIPCESCHDSGMPVSPIVDDYKLQMGFNIPDQATTGNAYDGQVLNPAYSYEATNGTVVTTGGSMSCVVYCHSDGTSVATGVLSSQPSPSWINGSTDCNTCHTYPPSYSQDNPKSNSHQRHIMAGFSCYHCHYGTTTNGTDISATGNHGNGQYDVVGSPTFYANGLNHVLNLVYEFDAGGGTCSTNSCHGYFGFNTPIRWGNTYLNASPSILQGDVSNKVNFLVTVTDCGNTGTCYTPFSCSFDWGDGTVETDVSCNASHLYPAEGIYYVTWNVWDTKNHSMVNYKTNAVAAQKVYTLPTYTPPEATVDPATGIVTVTAPETTSTGINVGKVYIYWGDRTKTVITPPIQPVTHSYGSDNTYRIRVVIYDANLEKTTFTYLEEPSLEVTVITP